MSLLRYLKYKDSGVGWIGRVPEAWCTKKFRYVFTESSEKIENEVVGPMLSVSGYRGIEIKEYEDENRRRLDEDLVGYRIVREGQLVVNTMWLNYAGLGVSQHEGHVSPAYRSYAISDVLHRPFAHHLMRSGSYVQGYTRLLTGIRPNSLQMSRDDLMAFPILIPPLPEQKAIACFLDRETVKIDALVAEQERLIELLKEKRQAVISHAVTKGLNPDVPMKESGIEWLGEIPKHWSTTQLKYATSIIVDCPHETPVYSVDGPYLVIRTADLDRGIIKTEGMYRVSENEYTHRIRRQALRVNDIVYGREGERWGHAGLVVQDDTFCLGQRMMQFRARAGAVIPSFLMWQLNARTVYVQGELDTVGATAPHVNVATIRNYFLALPPPSEQGLIADYLTARASSFDTLIAEAQRAIALLQERRTALISAAVTGQIDVRETAGRAA